MSEVIKRWFSGAFQLHLNPYTPGFGISADKYKFEDGSLNPAANVPVSKSVYTGGIGFAVAPSLVNSEDGFRVNVGPKFRYSFTINTDPEGKFYPKRNDRPGILNQIGFGLVGQVGWIWQDLYYLGLDLGVGWLKNWTSGGPVDLGSYGTVSKYKLNGQEVTVDGKSLNLGGWYAELSICGGFKYAQLCPTVQFYGGHRQEFPSADPLLDQTKYHAGAGNKDYPVGVRVEPINIKISF